jgi:hypothetical protein
MEAKQQRWETAMRKLVVLAVVTSGIIVGGFTVWSRTAPDASLEISSTSTHGLSGLSIHSIMPIKDLPNHTFDAH